MKRDTGKLLMLLLISSEAFFFIALIIAYVYYRNINEVTDTVAVNLEAKRAGVFTLLLIASSVTLIWSKKALRKQKWRTFKIGISTTMRLGVVFMIGQITEYMGL